VHNRNITWPPTIPFDHGDDHVHTTQSLLLLFQACDGGNLGMVLVQKAGSLVPAVALFAARQIQVAGGLGMKGLGMRRGVSRWGAGFGS
jgi:hypothetical protein